VTAVVSRTAIELLAAIIIAILVPVAATTVVALAGAVVAIVATVAARTISTEAVRLLEGLGDHRIVAPARLASAGATAVPRPLAAIGGSPFIAAPAFERHPVTTVTTVIATFVALRITAARTLRAEVGAAIRTAVAGLGRCSCHPHQHHQTGCQYAFHVALAQEVKSDQRPTR
jgi:hypothetical protein